jgi:hypothetical protein
MLNSSILIEEFVSTIKTLQGHVEI